MTSAGRFLEYDAAYALLCEYEEVTHFRGEGFSTHEWHLLERWYRRLTKLSSLEIYRTDAETEGLLPLLDRTNAKALLPLRGISALYVTPSRKSETYGYLALINRRTIIMIEADIAALQAFAYQLTNAIINGRLFLQGQELTAWNERQEFARNLHDAVSQTLFTATMLSETLPRLWERSPYQIPLLLTDINRLINGAQAEMRSLLLELHPTSN